MKKRKKSKKRKNGVFLAFWAYLAVHPFSPPAASPRPVDPDPEAMAKWIERMGDPSFQAREEAYGRLVEWTRRSQKARDAVERAAASHADLEVRERARMALAETEFDFAEFRLDAPGLAKRLRALAGSNDPAEAARVLTSLPRLPEAVPVLRRLLADRRPEFQVVRDLSVRLLGRIPCRESAEALLALAKDPQEPFRAEALHALGRLRVARATETMTAVALDPRRGFPERIAAVWGLTLLADPAGAPVFRALLAEPDVEGLSTAAAAGAAFLRDREAVDALVTIASAGPADGAFRSESLRLSAVAALGRIADARAAGPLSTIARDGSADPHLRQTACLALGELADPAALAPLWHCLADATAPLRVRKAAVRGLRRLTGWTRAGPVEDQVSFYKKHLGK